MPYEVVPVVTDIHKNLSFVAKVIDNTDRYDAVAFCKSYQDAELVRAALTAYVPPPAEPAVKPLPAYVNPNCHCEDCLDALDAAAAEN